MTKNGTYPLDNSKDNSGNNNILDVSRTNITLKITNPIDTSGVVNKEIVYTDIVNPLFGKITPIK